MNYKILKTILFPIAILVLFISCQNNSQKPSTNKELMFLHLGGEPTYLNPILSTDSPSSSVEGLIFSGLFRTNSDLELEPDLVETYKVNNEGTRYTFKIKENINGTMALHSQRTMLNSHLIRYSTKPQTQ